MRQILHKYRTSQSISRKLWKSRYCPSSPWKEAESKAGTLSLAKLLCASTTFRCALAMFKPRFPSRTQMSHWCFQHLHSKARVSNPAQCLSSGCFWKLISPPNFFLTQTRLVNTPSGGWSPRGVMTNPFYMITFFGHMRSVLWTSESSLPEQCMATALHGSLTWTCWRPQCSTATFTHAPDQEIYQGHWRVSVWFPGCLKARVD